MKKENRESAHEHELNARSNALGTMTMALIAGMSAYVGLNFCNNLGLIELGTEAVNTVVQNSSVQTIGNVAGLVASGLFATFTGACSAYGAKKTLSEYKAYRKAKKEEEMDR
ncbi:MAG: hypothetical protein E7361_03690 [Clostridiales bacterium]|nr:hypothetical protein [Clostridiales bacterium]